MQAGRFSAAPRDLARAGHRRSDGECVPQARHFAAIRRDFKPTEPLL